MAAPFNPGALAFAAGAPPPLDLSLDEIIKAGKAAKSNAGKAAVVAGVAAKGQAKREVRPVSETDSAARTDRRHHETRRLRRPRSSPSWLPHGRRLAARREGGIGPSETVTLSHA